MLKTLGENLSLLAILVVLVGVSSTDAYYASFGLKYQLLALTPDHILIRGLSAVFELPLIVTLYVIAIMLIAGQARLALFVGGVDRLRWLNYGFVIVLAIAGWWAGDYAGKAAASRDGTLERTTLPHLVHLTLKSGLRG